LNGHPPQDAGGRFAGAEGLHPDILLAQQAQQGRLADIAEAGDLHAVEGVEVLDDGLTDDAGNATLRAS
jgi:hypothetical protein